MTGKEKLIRFIESNSIDELVELFTRLSKENTCPIDFGLFEDCHLHNSCSSCWDRALKFKYKE